MMLQWLAMDICVIGMGYVGLPLALSLARYYQVIGYDIDESRVQRLRRREDTEGAIAQEQFVGNITFTARAEDMKQAQYYIICVPTDIDELMQPDLRPLKSATRLVAMYLKAGDHVIYESTVYPGCTEEVCLPILQSISGLTVNVGFKLGYSPERIVPGSGERKFEDIVKVVAASDEEGLANIAALYQSILTHKPYIAKSIKVAEAAKILENTQRYVNISLMNEVAILFHKLGINTGEVLEAAGTKWNFHPYTPGLVGGHCISVDPFYLQYKAKNMDVSCPMIEAGYLSNAAIIRFIIVSLCQTVVSIHKDPRQCKVLVMGVTFKENVRDIRNSKVFDLITGLQSEFGEVEAYDPYADAHKVYDIYGIVLQSQPSADYVAIIVTLGHELFLQYDSDYFEGLMPTGRPILFDLKTIYKPFDNMIHWHL